jgi:hypothetical protein
VSLFSKLRGTAETLFQVGLGGPQAKNNAGNLEARNATDAAFVIVRGATPVAANDLATKAYVDAGDTTAMSVLGNGYLQTPVTNTTTVYADAGFTATFTPPASGNVLIRWGVSQAVSSAAILGEGFTTPRFTGGNVMAASDANAALLGSGVSGGLATNSVQVEQRYTGLAASLTTLHFSVRADSGGDTMQWQNFWATIYSA